MAYELPPLPYAYNALEPHIDEQTVRIHHDKHHAGYVAGLNAAEEGLKKAREASDFAAVKSFSKALAFHGSGHILHTVYWDTMGPNGGGTPKGTMSEQIDQDFGSFDAFKGQFTNATVGVEGSGWGALVWSNFTKKLEILTAEKHENLTQWGAVPILVCDVWEHAYYLKYQNLRAKYVEAWWNVVDWNKVQAHFDGAK